MKNTLKKLCQKANLRLLNSQGALVYILPSQIGQYKARCLKGQFSISQNKMFQAHSDGYTLSSDKNQTREKEEEEKKKEDQSNLIDLNFDLDLYFEDIFRCCIISVLVTFQFW